MGSSLIDRPATCLDNWKLEPVIINNNKKKKKRVVEGNCDDSCQTCMSKITADADSIIL
jgi:hypothetical protein